MPGLVVQQRAAGVGRERHRDRLRSVFVSGLSLSPDDRASGRTASRRAARPKSSVAAMVSGIVATGVTWPPTPTARKRDPRLAVPQQCPIDRNAGRESRPVSARAERDLQGRGLAQGPVGGERPVVDTLQRGVVPGTDLQPRVRERSLPTKVISTSVSGRNTRC